LARNYGRKRALCQGSVTDLATTCASEKCDFTDRERRKVVVQHEALSFLSFETFQLLHVFRRAERGSYQGLGFTAREDRRAMGARQNRNFDTDLADLVEGAAVRAPPAL